MKRRLESQVSYDSIQIIIWASHLPSVYDHDTVE